jgi:hypothetical protein
MAYNQKNNPFKKIKGGGTKKVCLPAAKVRSMSQSERNKVTSAKRKAAKLRDWFEKENWVQVGNPSKKCGEK